MKLQNIKTYLEGKTTEQESAYILNLVEKPRARGGMSQNFG